MYIMPLGRLELFKNEHFHIQLDLKLNTTAVNTTNIYKR